MQLVLAVPMFFLWVRLWTSAQIQYLSSHSPRFELAGLHCLLRLPLQAPDCKIEWHVLERLSEDHCSRAATVLRAVLNQSDTGTGCRLVTCVESLTCDMHALSLTLCKPLSLCLSSALPSCTNLNHTFMHTRRR